MPEVVKQKKAIALVSGGLDSATALYLAHDRGFSCAALTFAYGQSHVREIEAARHIAASLGIEQRVVEIALPWKGSALLDSEICIPESRCLEQMSRDIPVTYVPARNTIFLAFAFSWAEVIEAEAIFIGANALDYSGYPDCRPEFFSAMARVFAVGTKQGQEERPVTIEAPLVAMSKGEIVREGYRLGVPFEHTWSCYQGGDLPCGKCDSCLLREKGFREAGVPDPLLHAMSR